MLVQLRRDYEGKPDKGTIDSIRQMIRELVRLSEKLVEDLRSERLEAVRRRGKPEASYRKVTLLPPDVLHDLTPCSNSPSNDPPIKPSLEAVTDFVKAGYQLAKRQDV